MKTLYHKINRRFKKIVQRFVPHNTRYRPSGVCKINAEGIFSTNSSELIVHPVYENELTRLDIPDALFEACSDYWKPKREVLTDYIIAEIPSGRVYTDNESSVAIVTKYNRVVENVSLSLVDGKVVEPNLNNIFEQRYFSIPKRVKGTVFTLLTGGAGLNNISHWFLDVLPRLHLLKESGLYDRVDYFLVPSLRYDYQRETLELLGIPAEKIITSDTCPHLAADCIIASTAPRGNHTLVPVWLCDFIQNAFSNAIPEGELPGLYPSRIYISRKDSKMRNVINEIQLEKELKAQGFETIVSSQLSIKEKIKIFSQAEVVVSATGAGLINMLFCKPGTRLIEIFNEGFVIEPFYDIAPKIGLDYDYIICEGIRPITNASQGQREDVLVDIERLLQLLKKDTAKDKRQSVVGAAYTD
ncbi:DUF563 domain-containing protein [Pontibacter sp. SGAir0037]|uniref:glycosyltransferase family 61 protein n=1 Tax=Pontibacter sp. SGAir0037 TaxID=2571030 RepID=UPI00143D4845|nr:glycosyltransferase family 61 protein [Pontibacter sp. SGAir0037]